MSENVKIIGAGVDTQPLPPSTPITNESIDFDIIKNSWNIYSLNDGSTYKSRFVLKEIWKQQDDKGQPGYGIRGNNEQVWLRNPDVRGPPSTREYTKEEKEANIELHRCSYTTVQYEPSEYSLDNGVRIKIFEHVISLSKTSLFDSCGDRHYLATVQLPTLFVVP